jgi:hypothetical protein
VDGDSGRHRGRLVTARGQLDRIEIATTAAAVVVSGSAYAAWGSPYLARGVVGDLLGFAVLSVPLVALRRRLRHEALVCLAGIGLVLLLDPDWPLRYSDGRWWRAFAFGLVLYLGLRRARLHGRWPRYGRHGKARRGMPR